MAAGLGAAVTLGDVVVYGGVAEDTVGAAGGAQVQVADAEGVVA